MSGVRLRPLRPGDEESAVRWGANEEFCLAIDWEVGLPPERLRRHWQGIITASEANFLRLGIEVGGEVDVALVGYTDLAQITQSGAGGSTESSAEFGIAIGEPARWGQGLGRRAGRLTLAHAFGELGLQTVHAEVHAPNRRSHALMLRLGFTRVGFGGLEQYRGELVPVVRYALERENFKG